MPNWICITNITHCIYMYLQPPKKGSDILKQLQQQSVSKGDLSVGVNFKGKGLLNASATFLLFFSMKLLWNDINNIS